MINDIDNQKPCTGKQKYILHQLKLNFISYFLPIFNFKHSKHFLLQERCHGAQLGFTVLSECQVEFPHSKYRPVISRRRLIYSLKQKPKSRFSFFKQHFLTRIALKYGYNVCVFNVSRSSLRKVLFFSFISVDVKKLGFPYLSIDIEEISVYREYTSIRKPVYALG